MSKKLAEVGCSRWVPGNHNVPCPSQLDIEAKWLTFCVFGRAPAGYDAILVLNFKAMLLFLRWFRRFGLLLENVTIYSIKSEALKN